MKVKKNEMRKEIISELKNLPVYKLEEILGYIYFVKIKDTIDPSQAYFWTKKWQKMEKEVEKDKKLNKVIGNGTVEGLLKELKG